MGFDTNVEFLRMAFWQIVVISGPLLAIASGDRPVDWHDPSGNINQ